MTIRSGIPALLAGVAAAALCSSCANRPIPANALPTQQAGESVVFIGDQPAALAYPPLRNHPLRVRSTYQPSSNTVQYVPGRDFVVDYRAGTLQRTAGSRLPDFRTNILFGKEEFDHTQFPNFGNAGYFAFVDYWFRNPKAWPVQASQAHFLLGTRSKLASGQPVRIVAFGDSITAGGEASSPELIFWNRYAEELRGRYPRARITIENGATGGDSTVQGLERLQNKVIDRRPDLVIIAFGMNDHNIGGVALPQFKQNLKQMIALIRSQTGAEVILCSTFPPNPKWKFGSHHMADYAAATERVAREAACAYADVFDNWQSLAARKKPEDLLGNNINHPNDFGHEIYARVLSALGL
jgi:acyl-CoA thioesterase I